MEGKSKNYKYHTKVSTGVYKTVTGRYFVRKQVDGKRTYSTFTNKAKAIKFYKSL